MDFDAQFKSRGIVLRLGLVVGSVIRLLKKKLNEKHISAKRIPHILDDAERRTRVKCVLKIPKRYPRCTPRAFSDVWTTNETWVHFFQ